MSVVASQLIAEVKAIGAAGAKADLLSVGEASDHAGSLMKTALLGAAVAAGAALVGVGVASIKSAADFQTAMLSNVAHAGLAKTQFDAVSQSVLAMAASVGRSPTQLAEALYPILSAFSGIQDQSAKSAIALDTLKMSFQTVAGTTVDGTAVANAAVGTFNALGLATNNVSENTARMTGLFDVMDKTVQLGNMQWDAYKNVVSKLAVAIQGTGISFNESQAALAELTNEGFSAQKASTYLANTFTTLELKTDSIAKHAKSLGIAFDEQKFKSMDLAHQIEYLNQVTDGNKSKILALLNNNATALKTFDALSTGINGYKNNLDALNHAQGTLASSFAEASQGFSFHIEQLKAAGQTVLIAIGTQLLPVASKVLDVITPLVTAFGQWISSSNGLGGAIKSVGTSLQPVSVMFQDLGHFLHGLDFGELIGSFHVLATTIGSIFSSLQGGGKGGPSAFDFFNNLDAAIKGLITGGVSNLTTIFQQLSKTLVELRPTFSEISNIIGGVFAGHMKTASDITQELGKWWQTTLAPAIQKAMPAFEQLARVLITDVVPGLLKIWAVGEQFYDTVARALVPVLEKAIPFFIRLESVIASGLAPALQFLMPYIVQAAQAIGQFADEIITRVAPIIEQWFDQMDKGLTAFLQIWNAVWPYLAPILQGVWDEIVGVVKIAWALVKGIVEIGLDLLSGNWSQAWEDFKTMLSGVWDGIKQILKGAWEIIAGWATGAWKLIASAISAPIQAVGNWLAGAWKTFSTDATTTWHNISSTISGIVTGITTWLVTAWQNAVNTVVGWFDWLYNHNYYFKALVDFIHDTTSAIRDWLISTWQSITGWIGDKWNWLAGQASAIWRIVSSAISSATNTAVNFLHGVWSAVIGWLGGVWNTISSKVQQGWSTISGIFSSAWGRYIAGPLGSLGSSIGGFFSGLATKAFTWGASLIQGLIDGLNSKLGAIGDAANNVASKITSILGFHHSTFTPPREGPASRADHWMPDFVQGIAEGIMQGMPTLQNAMSRFAGTLTLKPSSSGFAGGNLQLPSLAAASSSNHSFSIPIYIGADEVAEYLVDPVMGKATRKTRLRHGRRVF